MGAEEEGGVQWETHLSSLSPSYLKEFLRIQ